MKTKNQTLGCRISFFLLMSILLFGCTQKDSSVGLGLAPGMDEQNLYPQEMFIFADTSAFYKRFSTTGSSDFLYIGHTQGYTAYTLLMFNPYGSLPDSFIVDSIAVKVHLDSVIALDPYGNPMPVVVYPNAREQTWGEIGVTWDLIDTTMILDSIASFEIPSDPGDETGFTFVPYSYSPFKQDSLIRAWQWAGSGNKTLHFNNGLLLKTEKTNPHMIRLCSAEHDSTSKRPKLEMYLKVYDPDDTTGADPTESTIVLYAGGDAFNADDPTELNQGYLYLGNTVAYRSILLFNLEGLFANPYGTGIQRAEIILHADTSNASNLGQIVATYRFPMADSTWLISPVTEETAEYITGPVQSSANYDSENAQLTLVITEIAYDWIRYPETNFGLMFRSSQEYFDLSRTVFYGPDADSTLRPQMRIVYIENAP